MNKILVIDDDTAINELIKVNLELCGYKVIQAFDGVRGFALCKLDLLLLREFVKMKKQKIFLF